MKRTWTSAQLETARQFVTLIDTGRDAEADVLRSGLDRELGEDRCDELLEYVEEAVEKAVPDQSSVAEDYDLLPLPKMPLKKNGGPVEIPGYDLDQWCRPHGKGARRKSGPLAHRHYWEGTEKGQKKLRSGYRITISGKQRFKPDWWFGMARAKAEQLRRQGAEYE